MRLSGWGMQEDMSTINGFLQQEYIAKIMLSESALHKDVKCSGTVRATVDSPTTIFLA